MNYKALGALAGLVGGAFAAPQVAAVGEMLLPEIDFLRFPRIW